MMPCKWIDVIKTLVVLTLTSRENEIYKQTCEILLVLDILFRWMICDMFQEYYIYFYSQVLCKYIVLKTYYVEDYCGNPPMD